MAVDVVSYDDRCSFRNAVEQSITDHREQGHGLAKVEFSTSCGVEDGALWYSALLIFAPLNQGQIAVPKGVGVRGR